MEIRKRIGQVGAILLIAGALSCGVLEPPQGESEIFLSIDLTQLGAAEFIVTSVSVVAVSESHTAEVQLEIEGTTATGTLTSLPSGEYELTVTLYDGESIVATGSGSATIRPGDTTTAFIQIAPAGGDLVVVVQWGANVPVLISPEPGAVLDNGCSQHQDPLVWDFDWTDVAGAEAYHLYVRGANAIYPLVDYSHLQASSFHHEDNSYIINSNRLNWSWKVRAMVEGEWGPWSETRNFDAETLNTDCGG